MNNYCSTAVTSYRFHFIIIRVGDNNYEKYNFKVKRKPIAQLVAALIYPEIHIGQKYNIMPDIIILYKSNETTAAACCWRLKKIQKQNQVH